MMSTTRTRSVAAGALVKMLGVAFAAIFLVAGLWARSATQPLDDGVVVEGVVIEVDVRTDSDGDRTYAPIVDYVDPATGLTHRVTGSVSTSSRPAVGSIEEVSLRPGEPESARVVGPAWFPWIFIAVGSTMLAGVLATTVAAAAGGRSDDGSRRLGSRSNQDTDHVWTMVSSMPATPGFHPDPDTPGRLRYWDGSVWTDDYAPVIVEE
jgi:hypothetical protein